VNWQSPPTASTRYDALLQLLRSADTLWEASRVFFEQWELSPSQFNVLNLLESNPAGLSQTDLGRQLLTHRSNMTGLVDRLERRGLVERRAVTGDRRAYRVVLTAKGASLMREILPHYHREADLVWDGVPSTRIAALLSSLDQVMRNASQVITRVPARAESKK
jgi:DNA-binding MarR family transcriptional regulator